MINKDLILQKVSKEMELVDHGSITIVINKDKDYADVITEKRKRIKEPKKSESFTKNGRNG